MLSFASGLSIGKKDSSDHPDEYEVDLWFYLRKAEFDGTIVS
jgi:hypothetical protein